MSKTLSQPLAKVLQDNKIEPDQRLQVALSQHTGTSIYGDVQVFDSLLRQNSIPSRYLVASASKLQAALASFFENRTEMLDGRTPIVDQLYVDPDAKVPDDTEVLTYAGLVFGRAVRDRKNRNTLSVGDVLRALGSIGSETGHSFETRPFMVDVFANALSGSGLTPMQKIPELRRLLQDMEEGRDTPDDFEYMVAIENGRLAFRVASVVNDYVQIGDSGLLVPQRALVTHLGEIGFFTKDQVEELDDLINDPRAKEPEFQKFFERHPHFLRQWDHREVHPHVMLTREEEGPLIPDFILTNTEAQSAAILDLKRTLGDGKKKFIRRQDNRTRFADAIQEARAQLKTYGRWFEDPDNRRMLKSKVGMEIYNPRLMVVIGRSSEFRDGIERATLRADNPDVEIVTYDDIARHARDRMVIVRSG